MTAQLPEDEFLDDVDVYEGDPDPSLLQHVDETQDDADVDGTRDASPLSLLVNVNSPQNTTDETLAWYRANHGDPPFDPDGMCLKICRIARDVQSKYPSAFTAAHMTPESFRIHKVSDLRRGHVVYYDDPNDSNPFGHVTTLAGRIKGADINSLHDLLVWTNAVVRNQIVLVRGDYFLPHWGDPFTFGASWLNGVPFYDMQPQPKPKKLIRRKRMRIQDSIDSLNQGIPDLRAAVKANKKKARVHTALARDLARMIRTRDHLKKLLNEKEGK